MADNDLLIDVDIPIDIEGAYDPDGLPKVVARTKAPAAPPPVKPEDLQRVERERDAERAARTAAEKTAAENAKAAFTATDQLSQTTVRAYGAHYHNVRSEAQRVNDAIASSQAAAEAAERELVTVKTALASADENTDRAALAAREVRAQRELSRYEAELVTLQTAKHGQDAAVAEAKRHWEDAAARDAEVAKATAEAAKAPPAPEKQPTAEEWIAQCPAATQPWLREHREFTTDPKMHGKLMRFSQDYAEDNGGVGALDSTDFVAALNSRFFPEASRQNDVQDDTTPPPQQEATTRGARAPAAPPSRTASPSGGGGNGGGSRITLSALEQQTAAQMYPDLDRPAALKKYATNKARAIADGLYAPR